jgi:hypothetical protein
MRDALGELCNVLGDARGAGDLWRRPLAIQRQLDRLRSDLEDLLFRQHPREAEISTYYPGPDRETRFPAYPAARLIEAKHRAALLRRADTDGPDGPRPAA